MGDIVGGIIGGIGSIIGAKKAAAGEKAAAAQALTGFNYLSKDPLVNSLQANGAAASNGNAATVGDMSQLLTSNGTNNPAFKNYLNSTGYNFQLQQGQDAITGSAAAKGLLNSGATGKALEGYGENLAAGSFNNYLGQLGSVATLQGDQTKTGLAAADAVGQAGTAGGGNAGVQTAAAGVSRGTGLTNAFNLFGGGVQTTMNNGGMPNFFGGH